MDSMADNSNRSQDRAAMLEVERMKLERQQVIHEDRMRNDERKSAEKAGLGGIAKRDSE